MYISGHMRHSGMDAPLSTDTADIQTIRNSQTIMIDTAQCTSQNMHLLHSVSSQYATTGFRRFTLAILPCGNQHIIKHIRSLHTRFTDCIYLKCFSSPLTNYVDHTALDVAF